MLFKKIKKPGIVAYNFILALRMQRTRKSLWVLGHPGLQRISVQGRSQWDPILLPKQDLSKDYINKHVYGFTCNLKKNKHPSLLRSSKNRGDRKHFTIRYIPEEHSCEYFQSASQQNLQHIKRLHRPCDIIQGVQHINKMKKNSKLLSQLT